MTVVPDPTASSAVAGEAGRRSREDGFVAALTRPVRGFDLVVATLVAALILLAAAGTSYVRRTGDGQEYMAMALAISQLDRPAPNAEQLLALEERLIAIDADFGASIRHANLVSEDGRQDFPHFWMYSALSAPFVAMSSWFPVHPNWGFTLLNVLLLAGAFASLAWGYSIIVGLLFVLGPPLWWVDKAHTEAFTVALLLIGVTLLPRRPSFALPAFGLAATQNIPVAILVPIGAVYAAWRDRTLLRDRRFVASLALAGGLAALHPAYYLIRLGTYTSQAAMGAVDALVPEAAYLFAPIIDPNIGLLTRFPMLAPVALVALLTARERVRTAAWLYSGMLAVVGVTWLFAFAQNANLNHGGTPAISRYAIWLIPLAVPVMGGLFAAARSHLSSGLLVLLVSVSAYLSALEYHPSRPDAYYTPSWLAAWIWAEFPWLDNPPTQIFVERTVPGEVPLQSTATSTCSKVLVVDGAWPGRCGDSPNLPSMCLEQAPGQVAKCYANASTSGYSFATAP